MGFKTAVSPPSPPAFCERGQGASSLRNSINQISFRKPRLQNAEQNHDQEGSSRRQTSAHREEDTRTSSPKEWPAPVSEGYREANPLQAKYWRHDQDMMQEVRAGR